MFPVRCRPGDYPPHDPPRGQALVEFALAVPVVLFLILGGIEAGLLIIDKAQQDRSTGVVADYAAHHPGDASWHAVANQQLPGCAVTLDDTGKPGIVTVGSVCEYHPVATRGLWDGLNVSSEESAATSDPTPEPTASPS